jgi:SAM-dependent methyltransferase
VQLADEVGPRGRVIGVDIAPLLLDAARERTSGLAQVSFIESDALLLDLPGESVDAFFSRFGVMAFSDPVAAFSNFHRMLKPAGRLAFVCWRLLNENELDRLPLQAAALEHLVDATPFSFAAPPHVREVLEKAGFKNISIVAHDQAVTSGDLDAMTTVLLKVGPLGRIVRENPELRGPAEVRVRAALAAKGDAACVALQAATWIVTARA